MIPRDDSPRAEEAMQPALLCPAGPASRGVSLG
jgi:hypothetical protein